MTLNLTEKPPMRNRKSILRSFIILFAIFFLGLGVGSQLKANTQNSPVVVSSEMEIAADKFLMAIPRGFYAITDVNELEYLVKKKNAQLIDVREPIEYVRGHILNAINIPLRDLKKQQDQIATDRPVILYCYVGYRAAIGLTVLHLLGYDNVFGYPPSVRGWKAAGKSLTD